MNCNFTEKVSLLIDRELSREEEPVVRTHLKTCLHCQQAMKDFLLLRREIVSYQSAPDFNAQQQALRNILNSATEVKSTSLRQQAEGLGERMRELFDLNHFSPARAAAVATLALIIVALIGLIGYQNRKEMSPQVAVNDPSDKIGEIATTKPSPSPEAVIHNEQPDRRTEAGGTKEGQAPHEQTAGFKDSYNKRGQNVVSSNKTDAADNTQSILDDTALEFSPSDVAINGVIAAPPLEISAESDIITARHVEQAEELLRAFRNARLSDAGADLAYERQRSRKLLYQNIMIRREAANSGNAPIESLLDRLEPILVDIANLPDAPARGEVQLIKKRIENKNLVAMLQINASSASTTNSKSY